MKKTFQYLFRVVYIFVLPLLALLFVIKARALDKLYSETYGFTILAVVIFVFLLFNSFVIYHKVLSKVKLKPTLPDWIDLVPMIALGIAYTDKGIYIMIPFVVISLEWKK